MRPYSLQVSSFSISANFSRDTKSCSILGKSASSSIWIDAR